MDELNRIWKEHTGKDLTTDEAWGMIEFVKMVLENVAAFSGKAGALYPFAGQNPDTKDAPCHCVSWCYGYAAGRATAGTGGRTGTDA